MKKYAFAIITCALFAACGNNETKEEPAAPTVETSAAPVGEIDPICKMEREKGWTDYAVGTQGDTTWFCSATCKDAYVAKAK